MVVTSVLVLLGISTGTSFAQSGIAPRSSQDRNKYFEQLKSKLNLSDEESVKVRAIDSLYLRGLSTLKNPGDSRLSKFRRFNVLSSERDEQMKKVLSKDQYKQFQALKASTREELKHHSHINQSKGNI